MNGFDFDGVVSIGICPGPDDVIITGRSFEEEKHVSEMLRARGIYNYTFYNPATLEDRGTGTESSRRCSGKHKGNTIQKLRDKGVSLDVFFEDDDLQVEEILKIVPDQKIAHVRCDWIVK